jgi:hypothetical protein
MELTILEEKKTWNLYVACKCQYENKKALRGKVPEFITRSRQHMPL